MLAASIFFTIVLGLPLGRAAVFWTGPAAMFEQKWFLPGDVAGGEHSALGALRDPG